jgi:hypothetical protein
VHDPGGSTLFLQQRCNVARTVQQEDNNRSRMGRGRPWISNAASCCPRSCRRGSTLQKRDTKRGPRKQEARIALSTAKFRHTETKPHPRNATVPRRFERFSHFTRWFKKSDCRGGLFFQPQNLKLLLATFIEMQGGPVLEAACCRVRVPCQPGSSSSLLTKAPKPPSRCFLAARDQGRRISASFTTSARLIERWAR